MDFLSPSCISQKHYLALSFLMLSSHGMSPQKGARTSFFVSRLLQKSSNSKHVAIFSSNSFLALRICQQNDNATCTDKNLNTVRHKHTHVRIHADINVGTGSLGHRVKRFWSGLGLPEHRRLPQITEP